MEPGWRPWRIYDLELAGYDAEGREVERVRGYWIKETTGQ